MPSELSKDIWDTHKVMAMSQMTSRSAAQEETLVPLKGDYVLMCRPLIQAVHEILKLNLK